jgi:nicotinate-nucleotide pyrophosphorylase
VTFSLPYFDLDAFVASTLAEDFGPGIDVTSQAVIPAEARFAGVMDSRDAIIVAGLPIAAAFFQKLDPNMEIELLAAEGDSKAAGSDLMRLSGSARAMLSAERSALNGPMLMRLREPAAPCSIRARRSRACGCLKNTPRGWAGRPTTGSAFGTRR